MIRWPSAHQALLATLTLSGLSACHHDTPAATRATGGAPQAPEFEPKRSFTDPEISAAVIATLARDPGVDATNLQVKTTQGIVELTGSVDNLLTKQRAVRVAEAVRGVRSVSDRTELKLTSRPDSDVTKDVQRSLADSSFADAKSIVPTAHSGTVTLTGSVKSHQERAMAERLTEGVIGVRAVNNLLTVTLGTPRSDSAIAADVTSRLRWDALVNDGLIDVAVHEGRVTLSGKVASAAERRRARIDAWVLGASAVDDSGLEVDFGAQESDLRKHKLLGKTDGEIASAIHDAVAYDPRVSAADVLVSVTKGEAFLRGRVRNIKARLAAEDLARHTVGVLGLRDELTIKPVRTPSDAALATSVKRALLADPYTGLYAIDVKAKAGKVTLTGAVDSPFQRAEATDIASGIEGATDIDNKISTKRGEQVYVYSAYFFPYSPYWESWYATSSGTTRSDSQIAQDIHQELEWSPFVDAARIKVDVNHGSAKLTGEVDSQSERIAATEDAYAGGAVAVGNRLRLSTGS